MKNGVHPIVLHISHLAREAFEQGWKDAEKHHGIRPDVGDIEARQKSSLSQVGNVRHQLAG